MTNGTPITRSITDSEVDRVRVTITVPSLQRVEDDGDIVGTSIDLKIQVQYDGGGYNDVLTDAIVGKSSSRYQRDYLINLTGSFPVDLRVVRVQADSTSAKLSNKTFLAVLQRSKTKNWLIQTLLWLAYVLAQSSFKTFRDANI